MKRIIRRHGAVIIVFPLVPARFCVNIFGTIWTRNADWIGSTTVRHERIHTAQQRELLWIPFYIAYVIEWLVRVAVTRDFMKAYRAISFEREAYGNASDRDYLKSRPHYAQWRFRRRG